MCNLKEFLYSILRRWKIIIMVSVISLLLGSGCYFFEYVSNTDTDNTEEGASEDVTNGSLKENWEDLEKVYVGQLKFVGIGNDNVASGVVRDAYLAGFCGADFLRYIQDKCFEDVSLGYIREIVVPSDGYLPNYLGIDVVYYNEEECKNILSTIIQYVNENNEEMSKHLGRHELFVVVNTVEEGRAENYPGKIKAIQEVISEETEELREERSGSFSATKMLVYAVLCCVFANACLWFGIIVKDGLGDCIYSSHELAEVTSLEILGDFSRVRLEGKIDKIIFDVLIAGKFLSETGIANLINYKLKHKYTHKCDYLLVGKMDREYLIKNANILMETSDVESKFSVIGLIDENLEQLQGINEKQVLIYVVQRFVDNKKEVIQNINIYKELGMEIAGIVFI